MAEGCRDKVRRYKVEDEGIPTNTTKEQVVKQLHVCLSSYSLSNYACELNACSADGRCFSLPGGGRRESGIHI